MTAASTLRALRLIGFMEFIAIGSFFSSVFVKAFQKRRIFYSDLAIDSQTQIVPAADPIAVVQVGRGGVAIVNKGFVVAAAGAYGPRPAGVAVVTRAQVMGLE